MTGDAGLPGYRGFLSDRCVTIAEVLRPAGYFTAITGKWHLGDGEDSRLRLQRGFDRFYGEPEGGGFYFQVKPDRTIRLNNKILQSVNNPLPPGWYSTDAWTDYGLRFIDEARAADKPFFLTLLTTDRTSHCKQIRRRARSFAANTKPAGTRCVSDVTTN